MVLRNLLFCLLSVCCWAGCQPYHQDETLFEEGKATGTNKNGKLEEASGLAASFANPGYLWTHNDSGNPAEIFLISDKAATKRTFTLKGVENRDWEDIALGPGPDETVQYLYVGDIGDNFAKYPVKYIYRLKEPRLDDPEEIVDFDRLIVKLPDGIRDSEALMCDPVTKNLYLVSKREDSVRVYEIAHPFIPMAIGTDTLLAKKVCVLPLQHINGGSISADGKEVLLRQYRFIYYWKKKGDESIVDLLKTPPVSLRYDPEPNGEAICWAIDGSGFFTTSENAKGERGKLYFYKRK